MILLKKMWGRLNQLRCREPESSYPFRFPITSETFI